LQYVPRMGWKVSDQRIRGKIKFQTCSLRSYFNTYLEWDGKLAPKESKGRKKLKLLRILVSTIQGKHGSVEAFIITRLSKFFKAPSWKPLLMVAWVLANILMRFLIDKRRTMFSFKCTNGPMTHLCLRPTWKTNAFRPKWPQ
jgi:hypothetical protein